MIIKFFGQVLRYDVSLLEASYDNLDLQSSLTGKASREKWLKRRTTIKVKVTNVKFSR